MIFGRRCYYSTINTGLTDVGSVYGKAGIYQMYKEFPFNKAIIPQQPMQQQTTSLSWIWRMFGKSRGSELILARRHFGC